jgi:hypothetical protein
MLPIRYGATLVNRYAKKKKTQPKRKAVDEASEGSAPKRPKKEDEEMDSTEEEEEIEEPDPVPIEIVDEKWEPPPTAKGIYDVDTYTQRRYMVKFKQGNQLSYESVLAEDTHPTPDIRHDIIEQHLLADDPLNPFYNEVRTAWRRAGHTKPKQPPNPKRPRPKATGDKRKRREEDDPQVPLPPFAF